MKRRIFNVLRAAVSLFLIVILLYIMRDKHGQILRAIKGTNVPLFALAFLLFTTAVAIASFRFKLIIDAQGNIPVIFPEVISLTFIGYFFNNFLPTSIGGDVVKAYYLSKKAAEKTGSFTAVFVDRAIGLVTMVFMAFLAIFFVPDHIVDQTVKTTIYGITAVSVLILIFMANDSVAKKFSGLLFFVRPIKEKMVKAYYAIHGYKHHTRLMIGSLAISAISQLLFFFAIGIIGLSIGSRIPIMDILLKMPIISITSLLPSINGLGLREGSTVLLFGPLIGKENAFAISILWLSILLIMSLLGGIVYAISPQFKVRPDETGGGKR